MSVQMRAIQICLITTTTALVAAGCGSSATSPTSQSPSSTPSPPAPTPVTVLASPKDCDMQPLIVNAGPIVVTATSKAKVPISVSLFGPQDGAFQKRIARIRVLAPGDTQEMSADLPQGAYEMACGTKLRESRKRLTAL